MTPDERTALNEAVCKRLGWTKAYPDAIWWVSGEATIAWATPDFTSDWNAVYRWIVPAVKEMRGLERFDFCRGTRSLTLERGQPRAWSDTWILYATPEDYCRAFLAVTEVAG